VKFKLDENLSPSLLAMFVDAGHDAHSVVQQSLGGQSDERVIDVCRHENRALVTLDLDFSNVLAYPPANFRGIVVLRLADQAHLTVKSAVQRVLDLLPQEPVAGTLALTMIRTVLASGISALPQASLLIVSGSPQDLAHRLSGHSPATVSGTGRI
jgi:predicted nuclease of predicted toxin-antitoxin system